MLTIGDVVDADKNLATMSKTVKAANFEIELKKEGQYTLFAPLEFAFGKLEPDELAQLLKPENKLRLTALLNDHVVKGKTKFKEFWDGQKLKTVNGKELEVKVQDSHVTINGARILGRDKEASNGIVHSLDTVILFG